MARKVAHYESLDSKFAVDSKQFNIQYCHMYTNRTAFMREHLRKLARAKWGCDIPIVSRLIDIETSSGEALQLQNEHILIGVTFKQMSSRSSVIKEIKNDHNISASLLPAKNYASETDILFLEDESGRIQLAGSMISLMSTLVTGVVLAVKGSLQQDGRFQVTDHIFFGSDSTSSSLSAPSSPPSEFSIGADDSLVLIVSGFEIGEAAGASDSDGSDDGYLLACQMLVDFVSGRLGGQSDIATAQKIVRVIIAGNSIAQPDPNQSRDRWGSNSKKQLDSVKNMQQFDILLAQLLSSCPVDIMPGSFDPSGLLLPQQPLHPCLLSHSSRFSSLNLVFNPHQCRIDHKRMFLGHSGQPITDIAAQIIDSRFQETPSGSESIFSAQPYNPWLEILKQTVQWGHLCPTAPDTLPCYPLKDFDPFIIDPENVPDLFFAGNQPKFGCSTGSFNDKPVVLLSVPSFKITRQAVLVNLRTLACSPISFQTTLSQPQPSQVELFLARSKVLAHSSQDKNGADNCAVEYDDNQEPDI